MKGKPIGTAYGRDRAKRIGVATAAAAVTLSVAAGGASASMIEVDKTGASGRGSLARAVQQANARENLDTIVFSRSLRGTIKLKSRLKVTSPTSIQGRGYGSGGERNGRVRIRGSKHGSTISFTGQDPSAVDDLYLDRVGVNTSRGGLTVSDSYIAGHGMAQGPGIKASGLTGDGSLEVSRSTVTGFDQGIFSFHIPVRVNESQITNNVGMGGVYGYYSGTTIEDSTIAGNVVTESATLNDAGAGVFAVEGTTVVTNSTVSGNVAQGPASSAGGVAGSVTLNESTVTGNEAATAGGIDGAFGTVEVGNSIIAGNVSTTPGAPGDCGGGIISDGGNIVREPGACTLAPTDLSGVDPLLGPLADNGGPTPTHAITEGSPAIGHAVAATATPRDQRGVSRDASPDSGAFELRSR
jgi:hypothetical protein